MPTTEEVQPLTFEGAGHVSEVQRKRQCIRLIDNILVALMSQTIPPVYQMVRRLHFPELDRVHEVTKNSEVLVTPVPPKNLVRLVTKALT